MDIYFDKLFEKGPGGIFGILSFLTGIICNSIAISMYPGFDWTVLMVSALGVSPGSIFFNLGIFICGILSAIFYDASIMITDKFDPLTFWDEIIRYNITGVIYCWDILQSLMEQPPNRADKGHPLKWVFGFGASKDTWEPFEKRFGVSLFED